VVLLPEVDVGNMRSHDIKGRGVHDSNHLLGLCLGLLQIARLETDRLAVSVHLVTEVVRPTFLFLVDDATLQPVRLPGHLSESYS
jgi:hypothetical protein